ncbi:glycosyltransferase [Rhodococcoides fascians]|uniref:glycosyltransferase n=1 Tax=Rhodococcoides fascians TaxID=1828 RepID=UPI000A859D57|nr:glycosyltransferase [Rhodococcus fascians]
MTPIVEIGRRFVLDGHEVTMITGSRFADTVTAAGIDHVPLVGVADFDERDPRSFTPEIDRLTGMALSRHQVMGTFVRPIPDQARVLDEVLAGGSAVDVVFADATFAGVVPLLGRPEGQRPRVVGLGTLPLAQSSVDVPPYNSGLPVKEGVLARIRNKGANTVAQRVLFRSVQRCAAALVRSARGTLDFPILDLSRAFDTFVQLSPREFEYPRRDLSNNVVFAGPIIARNTTVSSNGGEGRPSWWPDDTDYYGERPIVHLTQGTLDNHDFTQLVVPALRALADLPVTVVVSTGGASVHTIPTAVPANAVVAEDVDYGWLLPRTALVITNGGFGTVQQALAHRAAVIVAPGGEDKREVAARVAFFGVGVDMGTRRPTPHQIRSAVDTVLASSTMSHAVDSLAEAIARYDPFSVLTRAGHLDAAQPSTAS